MIHVVFHRDPEVKRRLFEIVDASRKPLMVCAAHASPGVDVRLREPVKTFERFAGDLVDTVVVVDEGVVEGMWRDPMGDLCAAVFSSRADARTGATGYVFLQGRHPIHVISKSVHRPEGDVGELCNFARSHFDPERTPPPPGSPPRQERRRGRSRAAPPPPPPEDPGIDDPFAILGVPRTVTADEAKAAWRALVAKYHPDKVAHLAVEFQELAERRIREINGAYAAVELSLSGRAKE